MAESESKEAREAEDKVVSDQTGSEASAKTEKAPAAADSTRASSADQNDAGEGSAAALAKAPRLKRGARAVSTGIAHIRATFNNTSVAISDPQGGVISWSTAGRAGFKGSRKSTAFAATTVGQDAARQAVAKGMNEVEVRVCGAGAGRESAIRALQSSGLNVSVIKDVTPMPHNGCRSRKRRRV